MNRYHIEVVSLGNKPYIIRQGPGSSDEPIYAYNCKQAIQDWARLVHANPKSGGWTTVEEVKVRAILQETSDETDITYRVKFSPIVEVA